MKFRNRRAFHEINNKQNVKKTSNVNKKVAKKSKHLYRKIIGFSALAVVLGFSGWFLEPMDDALLNNTANKLTYNYTNVSKSLNNHGFIANSRAFYNMGITSGNVSSDHNIYKGVFDSDASDDNNLNTHCSFNKGTISSNSKNVSPNSDSDANFYYSMTKHTLTISDGGSNSDQHSDTDRSNDSRMGDYVKFRLYSAHNNKYVFLPYSILDKPENSTPQSISHKDAINNPLILKRGNPIH